MTPRRGRLCAIGAAATLLAACSAQPPRPSPPVSAASPPAPAPTAALAPPPVAASTAPANAVRSPWERMRRRFALDGCDYRPQVEQLARAYTRSPHHFEASWKPALPFLLLVLDEVEKRDLPGEFAMLPYVESGYRPLAVRDDRPAGMWQLDADTARAAGLPVESDYDARLDAIASTSAALDLIARYRREFADWRLADLAYNSGEFRARKLLGEREASSLSAEELSQFAFSATTHEHLDRLLALACIVEDPHRFGVTLPEPGPNDRLGSVALEAPMDLRLAARLAGSSLDDVKRWNAGYRRNRTVGEAKHRLLLPAARVERFRSAAATIPDRLWSDWREQRVARTGGIGFWAAQVGVPLALLAVANAVDEDATVARGAQLLLPGREPEPPAGDLRRDAGRRPRVHVVAAGDTLGAIAHRYSMPLARLKQLNPHSDGMLRVGTRLRLAATND